MENYVLRGVNLTVRKGEFVVIMGPSGCGKSTLCYCLNGLIPHLLGGEMKGRVLIEGLDTRKYTIAELSQIVGMVFQNPETQIVSMTVREEVAFGPENLALPRKEIRRRVEEALEITRLEGYEERSPYTLSGGEKQALAIASVLALRPNILVLDEPTSQLDTVGANMVSKTVERLSREYGMTIVAVDHRIEWAAKHAGRIIIMEEGEIVLDGEPHEVFEKRETVRKLGFRAPQVTELTYFLTDRGVRFKQLPVTLEEGSKLFREILQR
jgi:energy-coupling factor transport system ATP-binding protein